MKAEIEPLKGKYYGTSVSIEINGVHSGAVSLWLPGDRPSDRELANYGLNASDWDKNTPIDDGWGGKEPLRKSDLWCDSHHETQQTYELAQLICEAINNADRHTDR